ncbi:MFS transporter [Glutamicibacter ectropisis]|uniref:MFS transporter n=1 Tax=Glutamicibacter ectropisis TaxID=3046593 RepID=A0AAU6WDI7_9MICC
MDELTRDKVQRRTLWILSISQIFGTIGVGVAPSIGILLAEEVTSNEAWAGLARTASTLGAALLGIPLGNLAARHGRRIALASGWWLAALGGLLLVPAAQFQLVVPLFAGLLMIGSGSAISLQARFAATDLASDDHKGRSLALIVWVGTIGTVLGPNLGIPGRIIGDATGLHIYAGAFLIAGAAMAVAGLLVFVLMRPDPLLVNRSSNQLVASAIPTRQRRGIKRFAVELRLNAPARYAVVSILSAQVVMVAIMTMTPIHVTHHGGSVSLVGVTISLHILGMYALAPVVGYVADRWGYRRSIAVGLAIFVASLLVGGVHPVNMGWIMTSLILLGVGWSFINVSGSALFATVINKQERASVQGGVDALSNLCGATAAFAAGPLMALSSFSALTVVAGIVLLPLVFMTVVAPQRMAVKR